MPSSFEQNWNVAKKAFESATGKKKPSAGFLGIFHRSGLQDACKGLDAAFDKNAEAMQKALDKFRKEAADYRKTLTAAEKKEDGDYKKEVQKLAGMLDAIEADYQEALEQKLPKQVTLPDAISRSDNIYARCKTKAFELKPVKVSVGFTERSVRINKMVEAEFEGLIQTLIHRCSNLMRDMEIEVAKLVDGAEAKAEGAADEKTVDKIVASLEKEVTATVDRYKAQADETVEKLCADWFRKYQLASEYKKGFVKTVVIGTVSIAASVTLLALTGGGAAVPLALAIGGNVKNLLGICSAAYNYAKDINKTESKLISQMMTIAERFEKAGPEWQGKLKIESLEMLATVGLPISAAGATEKTLAEYAKKCVDYEDKHLRPLQQQFRAIMRDVEALQREEPKLGGKMAQAFGKIFDALAEENRAVQERTDLRVWAQENLDVLNGRRADIIKKLNKTVEAGSALAGVAGILKNIAEIAVKVAA